jgi:hypothetical protein
MRLAQNKKKIREKYPPKMLDVHAAPSARGATAAMAVLTVINLLNYIDRYVPSAVKDLIKEDLALTDSQTSYPTTVRAHTCTAMHSHAMPRACARTDPRSDAHARIHTHVHTTRTNTHARTHACTHAHTKARARAHKQTDRQPTRVQSCARTHAAHTCAPAHTRTGVRRRLPDR